ncbi:hypothetical protein HDZ31DRAFT_44029 [Schizophyllum fasciatum]
MPPPTTAPQTQNIDDVVGRLERLALSMRGQEMHEARGRAAARYVFDDAAFRAADASSNFPHHTDAPSRSAEPDEPTVIDTFSPRPIFSKPSPTSSISSHGPLDVLDVRSSAPLDTRGSALLDAFLATRSRVVRVSLWSCAFVVWELGVPRPQSLWAQERDGQIWAVYKTHEERPLTTFPQARALLRIAPSLSSHVAFAPALEGDLEPFSKLRRVEMEAVSGCGLVGCGMASSGVWGMGFTPTMAAAPSSYMPLSPQVIVPPPSYMSSASNGYGASNASRPGLFLNTAVSRTPSYGGADRAPYTPADRASAYATMDSKAYASMDGKTYATMDPATSYAISSNPPNPRTSFRLGDWICSAAKCGAHNFGRNVACIGCGNPRVGNGLAPSPTQGQFMPSRPAPSPRFAASFAAQQAAPPPPPPHPHQSAHPQNKPNHPLLTPSGRAFASGGSVKNISSDPLLPCFMFWPDNEPFPEQGQIRPSHLSGVPQPPILNTGNRGPITHQPGDWICKKCNYLNWRRRKVCQTCLPYAEGNGDSISAAVQAERIALLTNVLTQTNSQPESADGLSPQGNGFSPPAQNFPPHQQGLPAQQSNVRSQSMTPPQARRPFMSAASPPLAQGRGAVHRSKSHFDLGSYGAMGPGPVPPVPRMPAGYATGPAPMASRQASMSSGHSSVLSRQPSLTSRQGSPSFMSAHEAYMSAREQSYTQPSTPSYVHAASSFKQTPAAFKQTGTPAFMHSPAPYMPIPEPAAVPLLPSFLQDMVQPSPSLSPSSTSSSAELPFEDQLVESAGSSRSSSRHRGRVAAEGLGSIWRLDRKESRSMFNPFGPEAIGWQRSASRERVRSESQEAATLENLPATLEKLNM